MKNSIQKLVSKKLVSRKMTPEYILIRRAQGTAYRRRIRLMALTHYSPELVCKCCNNNNYQELTIDHIDGNGGEHRRNIFSYDPSSRDFYVWLKNHGFPEGFQVLCRRCNSSKGKGAVCKYCSKRSSELFKKMQQLKLDLFNIVNLL